MNVDYSTNRQLKRNPQKTVGVVGEVLNLMFSPCGFPKICFLESG